MEKQNGVNLNKHAGDEAQSSNAVNKNEQMRGAPINPQQNRKNNTPVKKRDSKKLESADDSRAGTTQFFDEFYKKLNIFKRLNARKFLSFDIDPDKIRYTYGLKSGKEIQIKGWGIQKFQADEKDRKKALQIALENIRSKVYSNGIETSVGIFSPEINIRQISLPKIKKESDLKNALEYKNRTDLPNYRENTIWSYEILNEYEKEGTTYYTILVTSAPYELIYEYIHIFDYAKIQISNIFPRPASIQASYRKIVKKPRRDLVINVGYDLTQMCFFKEGHLEFTRNVSIGSRNLEVSIHTPGETERGGRGERGDEQKSISTDSTSLLRDRLKSKISDLKTKQNPVLHTFFSEILRCMAYIQGRDLNQYIDRVFISGYGVRKESLIPYLRSRLNIPLFVLAPQFEKHDKRTVKYGGFFTTLGNSLQVNKSFNLLPDFYIARKIFRKLNRMLIVIILLLCAFLTYVSLEQKHLIQQKENLKAQYIKEYEQLNPFEGMYKELQKQIAEVNTKNTELQDYVDSRPPIIKVMQYFSNQTPKNIRLEKLEFHKLKDDNVSDEGAEASFKTEYQYQIDISVTVMTDALLRDVTLINFIDRIIDSGFFKRVELLNKLTDPEQDVTRSDARMYL